MNTKDNTMTVNPNGQQTDVIRRYLILSGEGNINTAHQFCIECLTLEEANHYFDIFKRGLFKDTNLFIYEAVKLRES